MTNINGHHAWSAHDGEERKSQRPPRDEAHILFVCTGNIARSASAELIARQRYGDLGLTFESAGVGAMLGWGVADDVRGGLRRRHIVTSSHVGRQIEPEMAQQAGLVLALDRSHRRLMLEEWPRLVKRVALLAEAASVAERAAAAGVSTGELGDAALRRDGSRRPGGSASVAEWIVGQCSHSSTFDVADPFRRGDKAGETAVTQIERALDVLLPWYAAMLGGEAQR